MIKIKVCGICDPVSVKEIVNVGPDYMGFIFYPESPRFVGYEPGPELFRIVPPGILKVGVFVNENIDKILDLAMLSGIDIVQLHGNESPDYCLNVRSSGLKIIKSFSINGNYDFGVLSLYKNTCDYFLFDKATSGFGGSGKKFNWDSLTGYELDKPFFLSGGIGPDDTEKIKKIENRAFFAVDINSRFENAPGKKNSALVRTFIDEIKKIDGHGL